jgi:hypothetical protein
VNSCCRDEPLQDWLQLWCEGLVLRWLVQELARKDELAAEDGLCWAGRCLFPGCCSQPLYGDIPYIFCL